MRIGIIGPTEREIMPFIGKIPDKRVTEHAMLKFHSGIYEGVEVVSVFSGVCKVNAAIAAQILIDKFEVTHILLTGVAGALNKQLKLGDKVISNEVAYHDVDQGILTEYHPWMKDRYFRPDNKLLEICEGITKSLSIPNKCYIGRIITGEYFVTHVERESLIQKYNPLCVDMESASVAHVCYVNKIPFIVIRSISDAADENGAETFEVNMEKAALNSIKLVEELIRKLHMKK